MNIGLIQTRGIGDIVIAAPIAQYHIDRGNAVFWPIDNRFFDFAQAAFPEIHFIPVDAQVTGESTAEYWYQLPMRELAKAGCEQVFCLYSYLSGVDLINPKLAHSLKFDEYKYAVTGVPFAQKWKLRINRNKERENELFRQLKITRPYILLHEHGSNFHLTIQLPPDLTERYQIIRISELSKNPFDWLGVIEQASIFACVDSCFANLAEQLDLCAQKFLFLRSDIRFTPVFKNNWQFR
jgi:hypothetical protein